MCSSQPWCADGRGLKGRLTRRAHAGARACEVEEFGGHGAMIAHGFRGRTGLFAGGAAAQGASRCPGTVCFPHSESDRGDGHAKCGVFGFSVSRFFSLLLQFFSFHGLLLASRYCTRWMRVKCCTIWFAGVHSIVRHGAAHSHGKEGVRCACSAAH